VDGVTRADLAAFGSRLVDAASAAGGRAGGGKRERTSEARKKGAGFGWVQTRRELPFQSNESRLYSPQAMGMRGREEEEGEASRGERKGARLERERGRRGGEDAVMALTEEE